MATLDNQKRKLFNLPTRNEVRACWELCRLHNNIGFWVVWLPTAWAVAMAYHAQTDITTCHALFQVARYIPLCFGIKSLIMTIDDILDSDVDGLVERTKLRPLPRGAISLQRAWCFFFCQVAIGVSLAKIYLSPTALHISMFAWPLYIIYPTCKRWTDLAPIPLGLMFKVGVFMGWADVSADGQIPWKILTPVYIGSCLWTVTYETVYQHQDKKDDMKIGLHSPALFLSTWTIPICCSTAVGFLSLLLYGGYLNGQGVFFYLGVAIAGAILIRKLILTDLDNPNDCKNFFLQTVIVGQVILGGLVLDGIYYRIEKHISLQ